MIRASKTCFSIIKEPKEKEAKLFEMVQGAVLERSPRPVIRKIPTDGGIAAEIRGVSPIGMAGRKLIHHLAVNDISVDSRAEEVFLNHAFKSRSRAPFNLVLFRINEGACFEDLNSVVADLGFVRCDADICPSVAMHIRNHDDELMARLDIDYITVPYYPFGQSRVETNLIITPPYHIRGLLSRNTAGRGAILLWDPCGNAAAAES